MGKPFKTKIKVRFGDVDRAGIAYFPRIIGYFHYAFEEFWESYVGIPYNNLINRDNIGFPTVHVDVDFLKPISFGDVLTAVVSVPKIGRSSVVFRYLLCKGRTVYVRGDLTLVAIDIRNFKPRVIPQRYRKAFLRCGVPLKKAK